MISPSFFSLRESGRETPALGGATRNADEETLACVCPRVLYDRVVKISSETALALTKNSPNSTV